MALKSSKLIPRPYSPGREPLVIGYLRIHDNDTKPQAQEAMLGTVEALFIDATSGVNSCQPQLNELMAFARPGDVIRVATIDRLGTTLADAIDALTLLTGIGLEVQFGDQKLICQPVTLERSTVEERDWLVLNHMRDADRALRKAGTIWHNPIFSSGEGEPAKPALSIEEVGIAEQQIAARIPRKRVAEGLGVSPATLFLALHRHGEYSNYP